MELEIAKEIVTSMIQNGALKFSSSNGGPQEKLEASEHNAKTVAAAFDIVYDGVLSTLRKER